MLRFFKNNTQVAKELNELDYSDYLKVKRSRLFSRLCLLGALAAFIQGGYDLYDGFPYVMLIDIGFASVLFLGYYLNHKGKYHFATILIFLSSNFILFGFASIVPRGVGIFLLYFPLIAFSFISYDYQHRHFSIGFTILSIILNGVLIITDYQPFGNINLQPTDPTPSFAINMFFSIVLLGMGINFLIRLNHKWEQVLLKNQRETKRLSEEITKQNTSLEKTNQELDRFVYSTSHDLRAPLASILGLINLTSIEKEPPSETIKGYLEMIKDRVNSLDDFISDIIDYSKNSRTELSNEEVNLNHLMDEVIKNNKYLENADKVSVSTNVKLNTEIILDRKRLFRVLNNLVSNAIKYSDLSKPSPFIIIDVIEEPQKHITIEVKDNGIGIEDEYQNNVFQMFYRATETASGSGLGLYIAQEMVSKMDGSISLKSQFQEGSIFTITLPLITKE